MSSLLKKSSILTASIFSFFSLEVSATNYHPCPSEAAAAVAAENSRKHFSSHNRNYLPTPYLGYTWTVYLANPQTSSKITSTTFKKVSIVKLPSGPYAIRCSYEADNKRTVAFTVQLLDGIRAAYKDPQLNKELQQKVKAGTTPADCDISLDACQFEIINWVKR